MSIIQSQLQCFRWLLSACSNDNRSTPIAHSSNEYTSKSPSINTIFWFHSITVSGFKSYVNWGGEKRYQAAWRLRAYFIDCTSNLPVFNSTPTPKNPEDAHNLRLLRLLVTDSQSLSAFLTNWHGHTTCTSSKQTLQYHLNDSALEKLFRDPCTLSDCSVIGS